MGGGGFLLGATERDFELAGGPYAATAARLEPDLAQAHYRLAQAYQRTGQNRLAAKELEIFERLSKQGQPSSER